MTKTVVNIGLGESDAARIKELMEICGTSTEEELIKCAFVFFDTVIEEIAHGRDIISVNEKTGAEVRLKMAVFEKVKKEFGHDYDVHR